MGKLTKQTRRSLNPQWEARSEETLSLSKAIISDSAAITRQEIQLTIADTFSRPTIRSVFKEESGQIGFSVVKVLAKRFADSFGFSTRLNDVQVDTITVDTLENFAYESLEDIIIFFKMARSGKFGATGRGIDSNLIFGDWFPKYLGLKAELREQEYQRKKGEQAAEPVTMEDVRKTYSEIKTRNQKKVQLEKVTAYVEKITQTMDRQVLEDTITDWEKDPVRKPFVRLLKAKRKTIK